jgi:acyl transferase domain-containing protein
MRSAYKRSGRNPEHAHFLEMHCTGTAVGDPTEANWVGRNFRRENTTPLYCGSIKGNLG